ncbi:hypothetical protein B1218_38555, partial [Pseudomonas ogarae]
FYDTNANADMPFTHSARSPNDLIYHREREHTSSPIHYVSWDRTSEKHGGCESWRCLRDYFTADALQASVAHCGSRGAGGLRRASRLRAVSARRASGLCSRTQSRVSGSSR